MPNRQARRMCPCHQNSRNGHSSQHPMKAAPVPPPDAPRKRALTRTPLPNLKRISHPKRWLIVMLLLLLALLQFSVSGNARADEGLALAIVYDTSGSMREPVTTADGKRAAKYLVGNRALEQ